MQPTEPTKRVLRNVASSAIHNGLVLFLGAGVNGGVYPLWVQLVEMLLDQSLMPFESRGNRVKWLRKSDMDVYARATLAKELLGKNYTEVLRNAVYTPVKEGAETHVTTVAEFCLRDEVKAVVTYNYDTHLEDAYAKLPAKRRDMISVGLSSRETDHEASEKNLVVYHVHGLLNPPRSLRHRRDDRVVLTYDEYTDTMRDISNWASATQIHFLRTRTCLFLGQSLSDWNVLRLLEAANVSENMPRHWLFGKTPKEFNQYSIDAGEPNEQFVAAARATLLESVGVNLAGMGNEWKQVYATLKLLAREISDQRRRVA